MVERQGASLLSIGQVIRSHSNEQCIRKPRTKESENDNTPSRERGVVGKCREFAATSASLPSDSWLQVSSHPSDLVCVCRRSP